jgi:hypothetical protein
MLQDKIHQYVELACPNLSPSEKRAFSADLFEMAAGWPSWSDEEKDRFLKESDARILGRSEQIRADPGAAPRFKDLVGQFPRTFRIDVFYPKKSSRSVADLIRDTDRLLKATVERLVLESSIVLPVSQRLPLFGIEEQLVDERGGDFVVIPTRITRRGLIKRDVRRSFEHAKRRTRIAQHRIIELPLFEEADVAG